MRKYYLVFLFFFFTIFSIADNFKISSVKSKSELKNMFLERYKVKSSSKEIREINSIVSEYISSKEKENLKKNLIALLERYKSKNDNPKDQFLKELLYISIANVLIVFGDDYSLFKYCVRNFSEMDHEFYDLLNLNFLTLDKNIIIKNLIIIEKQFFTNKYLNLKSEVFSYSLDLRKLRVAYLVNFGNKDSEKFLINYFIAINIFPSTSQYNKEFLDWLKKLIKSSKYKISILAKLKKVEEALK